MAGPGVISFTRTEKYSSLIAEALKEMRDARVFSDFKINIKEETLPCHRLVLSVHSAMLKAMLTSDIAEAAKHSIKLDHIDLDIMQVILDYMYIGQASFQTEQLHDMIIACDYLRINMLKDMCVEQVTSILQPANAIPWLKLSQKLNLSDVKAQCLEIVVANFTTISRQPDFVDLSIVTFQECLSHVQHSRQQQDEVLDAALRWVDRDSTERLDHLETLVDQVQLDLCSLHGILGAMKNYKTIVVSAEALFDRLTSAAMDVSSLKANVASKQTVTLLGGHDYGQVNRVCWKLTEDKQVVEMFKIPFGDLSHSHSVCSTPVGFIISGGWDSTLCVMFNAETNKWIRLQSLMGRRYSHGSIFFKGVLYVVGGIVGGPKSKSLHSFMVEGGSWEDELDLPISLVWPKMAALDEGLFLLDKDSGRLLHLGSENVWTRKASLPAKSYDGVSMTSHNGKLYVAGADVFAWYSPKTDTWVQGHQPNKLHVYGPLVYHDNKLLLLRGSANGGTDEVEEYDFTDESWTICSWTMPALLDTHYTLVLNILEQNR